jgi:predicted outer membrane repeat protein
MERRDRATTAEISLEASNQIRLIVSHIHNTCRGSELIGNAATAGGAIYIGAGCTLEVNSTIHFYNNTATQPSSGGAIYLDSGAQLIIGRSVPRHSLVRASRRAVV